MKRAVAETLILGAVLCLVSSLESFQASAENPQSLQPQKSEPVVDYLIHTLKFEEWFDDEACREATLRVLYGVKNDTLWATSIWNAMQPPFGVFYGSGVSFGSYDQCLRSPWSTEIGTQYCLVEVKICAPRVTREFGPYDSADEYLNTLSKAGKTFNHFNIGVCMPAVCTASSIAKFYSYVLRTTHLPEAEVVKLSPEDCQRVETEPYPKKFYAFWSVIGLLLGLVVVSTIYAFLNETKPASNIDCIAEAFNMVRNWEGLLKVSSTEIKVLNGIKFLSAFIVVLCHQVLLCLFEPSIIINHLDIDAKSKGFIGKVIVHSDLVVDTFFALSGLLLAKSLQSGRQKNLLVVLFKRYLRLMSPYAVMLFYFICTAQYTAAGPIWLKSNAKEKGFCEVHWWKNLLMINTEFTNMCYRMSWYVTCDYHLAVLIVVLYWIYRQNQTTGVLAFIAVGCGLTLKLTVKAYIQKIPLLPVSDLREYTDMRSVEILDDVYVKWQDRAGSYLVGIAMGWLMTKYKPAVYRNTISKRTSLVIAVASLGSMGMVISIGYWLGENRMEVAVAVATNRMVWAAAICGLISACEYGSVPVISDFLGSAVFVPLGKLSYGIYLTHSFVIQRNILVTRSLLNFDLFNVVINGLGTTIVSCAASLVLYILVEAPCIYLINCYLSEKKKEEVDKKAVNVTVLMNGANGATKFKGS